MMKLISDHAHHTKTHGGAEVITFSVELGTPGYGIARMVAAGLGYSYFDSQITSRAAEKAGFSPETFTYGGPRPLVERIVERLFVATIFEEELPSSMIGPEPQAL